MTKRISGVLAVLGAAALALATATASAQDVLPDLDQQDLTGSLYTLFAERYDCTIDRAEQTVRAGEADRETGPLLGLPTGRPVLVFDRVSYSAGRPVEHAESTYRGDRYELQMTVETGAG